MLVFSSQILAYRPYFGNSMRKARTGTTIKKQKQKCVAGPRGAKVTGFAQGEPVVKASVPEGIQVLR
jgi:hypothetical protein